MLYRSDGICGTALNAADGQVGKIKDLYFDDFSWVVRYLVVETGSWLSGREVLIAPEAVQGFAPSELALETSLTRDQVKNSPLAASEPPVSRQFETQLHSYYGWNPYWENSTFPSFGIYGYPNGTYPYQEDQRYFAKERKVAEEQERLDHEGDMHLRSLRAVRGYRLQANDGLIGELLELLVEKNSWRITHLVVDTQKWWPGKHVVIDKGMVLAINFEEGTVDLDMTRAEVKASPEYQPSMTVGESYEENLSNYYKELSDKSMRYQERLGDLGSARPKS